MRRTFKSFSLRAAGRGYGGGRGHGGSLGRPHSDDRVSTEDLVSVVQKLQPQEPVPDALFACLQVRGTLQPAPNWLGCAPCTCREADGSLCGAGLAVRGAPAEGPQPRGPRRARRASV
jgi:hypothetical protein